MSIDANFRVVKEEKKTYPPLPKNIYPVEILAIDLVDAKGKYSKPGDKNFSFQFTVLAGKDKEENLRGRNLWDNFVPTTLFEGKKGKCSLWRIAEAVLGRELTQQEMSEGFDGTFINSLIGKQIKVYNSHNLKNGTTYNLITDYMSADVLQPALSAEEKDKAAVKHKEQPKEEEEEEISVDSIPF